MAAFKIAVVVGSNRRESINRRLAEALAKLGPDRLAFHFVQIGDLPLYNQDDEGNLPSSVTRFKAEIAAADGVLFVTPEHSRSIPAALKNAIDWVPGRGAGTPGPARSRPSPARRRGRSRRRSPSSTFARSWVLRVSCSRVAKPISSSSKA